MLIFYLSYLACAFSTRIEVLILFRILQGFGTATMIPGTLSILIHEYPENQRGLAIGLNSGIGGIGLVAGAVVTGLGFMYVIGINVDSTYMSKLFPSLVIRGIGIPFLVASTSIMMMNSVSEDKSGLASGVLNMSKNIGTAFGVAILGQVFTVHGFSYIAVCCILGMIPIFISDIILTKIKSANVSKL